ncbi:hypothetical protein BGP_6290 [Beggiatoa sp. PS]|nr:hypothetical protein BGP_6290 [Beggiatoa sp. PS]
MRSQALLGNDNKLIVPSIWNVQLVNWIREQNPTLTLSRSTESQIFKADLQLLQVEGGSYQFNSVSIELIE